MTPPWRRMRYARSLPGQGGGGRHPAALSHSIWTSSRPQSHAGKVVLRSWYEKNKHIFPASRWEPYDPEKKWDKYTVWKPSSAGWKPSWAGRLEAHPAPLRSPLLLCPLIPHQIR